ncbi:MAG: Polymorphic membrane protein, partial [Candidatus Falkowbacteria bacterium GW2011_GWF2_39_8]
SLKALDGTPSITIEGPSAVIEAGGYFLLERTDDDTLPEVTADAIYVGALEDSGEDLELRDENNNSIDVLNGGNGWLAGEKENHFTMERNAQDVWQNSLVAGGTPRAENSIIVPVAEEESEQTTATTTPEVIDQNLTETSEANNNSNNSSSTTANSQPSTTGTAYDFNEGIIISEILPNPVGDDLVGEFIEIYNKSEQEVNLLGWKLQVSGKDYEFGAQASTTDIYRLKANGYLVVWRKDSKLTLNNTGSEISLFQPQKTLPLHSIKYEQVKEGCSYARGSDGTWHWTEMPTPGRQNILKSGNHPPLIVMDFKEPVLVGQPVLFDSSDTTDEDDDRLFFYWNFGDGATSSSPSPSHVYLKSGKQTIKLTVDDGKEKISLEKIFYVQVEKSALKIEKIVSGDILINEIMPNSLGEDADQEWIELYNRGKEMVDLLGWSLDDKEGESKGYRFAESTQIKAGSYYILEQAESGLVLNNTLEEVRLFNPNDVLADLVKYEKAKEAFAYARQKDGQFIWTKIVTPGKTNSEVILTTATKNSVAKKSVSSSKAVKGVKISGAVSTSIDSLSQNNVGEKVQVRGVVIVTPGILGTQIFYLSDKQKSFQIYNYRKAFPKLKIGDLVEVAGEVSESNGELRIKTSAEADIKVLGKEKLPLPINISCDKLTEEYLGQLITIDGEITKKTGSTMYLDDGTDEAEVYIKTATGINKADYIVGEQVAVTGIANKTKSGIRILPRGSEDLKKTSLKTGVAGEISNNDQWTIAGRDKKAELINYLWVITVGLVIFLMGWIYKIKKKS